MSCLRWPTAFLFNSFSDLFACSFPGQYANSLHDGVNILQYTKHCDVTNTINTNFAMATTMFMSCESCDFLIIHPTCSGLGLVTECRSHPAQCS